MIPHIHDPLLIFDHEPIETRLPFRYNNNTSNKEAHTMPEMKKSDFGRSVPTNYAEILQFINNAILHHEETVFWDNDPDGADRWEEDLIRKYLAGDRSGILKGAPEPKYK